MEDAARIMADRICKQHEMVDKAKRLQDRAPHERTTGYRACERVIERHRARLEEDYTVVHALGLTEEVSRILYVRGVEY